MIVFDLETTGVNIFTDRIVEITAVKVNGKLEIVDGIHFLINPTILISPGASKTHGIVDEQVKDKPTFKDVAEKIITFFDKSEHLCGYNVKFDCFVLDLEFNRAGIPFNIMDYKIIDLLNLWKANEPRTLSVAMRRFLNIDHDTAHTSTGDVEAVVDLFNPMLEKFHMTDKTWDELSQMHGFYMSNKVGDGGQISFCGGKAERDGNGDMILKFGTKFMNRKVKNLIRKDIDWLLLSNIDMELKYWIYKEAEKVRLEKALKRGYKDNYEFDITLNKEFGKIVSEGFDTLEKVRGE